MSDLEDKSAEYFYQASREHWSIENSLHHVKDVVHQEDENRIRNDTGAMFASIASSIAINMSRRNQEWSISYSQIFFRSNTEIALNIIRT